MTKRKDPKPEVGSVLCNIDTDQAQTAGDVEEAPKAVEVQQTDMDRAMNLCGFIIEGDSVRLAAHRAGIEPTKFYRMMAQEGNEALVQHYTRARAGRADARFEKVDEIMEDLRNKVISPEQARILLDAIKWQTGKENAKRYGEKVDVTSGGEKLAAPIVGMVVKRKSDEG